MDFPGIIPMNKSKVEDQVIKDPYWLAGFIEGEGCFLVDIFKSSFVKSGYQVKLKFILTQHSYPVPPPNPFIIMGSPLFSAEVKLG
jgi:hypothetical protein